MEKFSGFMSGKYEARVIASLIRVFQPTEFCQILSWHLMIFILPRALPRGQSALFSARPKRKAIEPLEHSLQWAKAMTHGSIDGHKVPMLVWFKHKP
jgi:hypothetical protein